MKAKCYLHDDIKQIKELVYDQCELAMTNVKFNSESVNYGACSFELSGSKIQYRISKITPTKIGQFVAIWKRNKDGLTVPFHSSDNIDLIVITARSGENLGQFVFSKLVLVDKGIVSINTKEGKRGIRVYPPWDIVSNKPAEKTQRWQNNYFLAIKNDNSTDLELAKRLYLKGNETG